MRMNDLQMVFNARDQKLGWTVFVEVVSYTFFLPTHYLLNDPHGGCGAVVEAVKIGGVQQRPFPRVAPSEWADGKARETGRMDLCVPGDVVKFFVRFERDCEWWSVFLFGRGAVLEEAAQWRRVDGE